MNHTPNGRNPNASTPPAPASASAQPRPASRDAEALVARFSQALQANHEDEAQALLDRAARAPIKTVPSRTVTLLRASLAGKKGEWSAARELYISLLQQTPTLPEAWYGLGLAHLMLGDAPQAVEAQRRAVVLVPKHPSYQFELGRALALAGAGREAVHHLVLCVRLNPQDPRGYRGIAHMLHERHPRMAERLLALAQAPQAPAQARQEEAPPPHLARENALIQQVNELLGRGRNRDALKLLREASAQGLNTLGLKLLEAEACEALLPPDLAGAEQAFAEAIALAPQSWLPRNNLGLFLLRQSGMRGLGRALEVLEEARRLGPQRPEALLNLALGYYKAGRHGESVQFATRLVQGLPPGHPLLTQARALASAKAA